MCDKYKITSPLFFRITSDQYFFFRLKVEWISHLMVVFLCNNFFDICKFHCRDLTHIREFNTQYF